jgi:hypothetical protein
MSTQEFSSLDDINDDFLNKLFPQSQNTINSVLRVRDETKKVLNNPSEIFNVEFQPGMTLDTLARDYLGDSFLWESIAVLNDVTDPTEPISIGRVLKIPTTAQIKTLANKFIAPEAQKVIDSVKGSILDLTGLNKNNSKFATNLKDCINKIIDFKVTF